MEISVHALLHIPFEGTGCIADWVAKNKFHYTETRLWEPAQLPDVQQLDLLIIMGGPMSVNDEKKYPWLHKEKLLIEAAINEGKQVLGICLGAQLIANVLGARVYPHEQKEIGWFPVRMNEHAQNTPLHFFPKEFVTFHWHGETFDLPYGATLVAHSDATPHQAFTYGDNVFALQFHPEMTPQALRDILEGGDAELQPAKYIQTAEEILANL